MFSARRSAHSGSSGRQRESPPPSSRLHRRSCRRIQSGAGSAPPRGSASTCSPARSTGCPHVAATGRDPSPGRAGPAIPPRNSTPPPADARKPAPHAASARRISPGGNSPAPRSTLFEKGIAHQLPDVVSDRLGMPHGIHLAESLREAPRQLQIALPDLFVEIQGLALDPVILELSCRSAVSRSAACPGSRSHPAGSSCPAPHRRSQSD